MQCAHCALSISSSSFNFHFLETPIHTEQAIRTHNQSTRSYRAVAWTWFNTCTSYSTIQPGNRRSHPKSWADGLLGKGLRPSVFSMRGTRPLCWIRFDLCEGNGVFYFWPSCRRPDLYLRCITLTSFPHLFLLSFFVLGIVSRFPRFSFIHVSQCPTCLSTRTIYSFTYLVAASSCLLLYTPAFVLSFFLDACQIPAFFGLVLG